MTRPVSQSAKEISLGRQTVSMGLVGVVKQDRILVHEDMDF